MPTKPKAKPAKTTKAKPAPLGAKPGSSRSKSTCSALAIVSPRRQSRRAKRSRSLPISPSPLNRTRSNDSDDHTQLDRP